MNKVYINMDDTQTNTYLNEAISAIKNANNSYASVPNDFRYLAQFNTIKSDIATINSELYKAQTWLANTQKSFKRVENELEELASNISSVSITKAQSIVK